MAREAEEKLALVGGCGFCREAVVAARERPSEERRGREKRWNLEENSLADLEVKGCLYVLKRNHRIQRQRLTNCVAEPRMRDCESLRRGGPKQAGRENLGGG